MASLQFVCVLTGVERLLAGGGRRGQSPSGPALDEEGPPRQAGARWVKPVSPAPQGRRVLLAEDNLINQTVAKKMLSQMGLLCVVAANGAEAVGAVAAPGAHFDVVLMDMAMPVMGGVCATKVLPPPLTPRPHPAPSPRCPRPRHLLNPHAAPATSAGCCPPLSQQLAVTIAAGLVADPNHPVRAGHK